MTKTDYVSYITEDTGLTKADVMRVLDSFQRATIKGLKENGKCSITGFMTLTAKDKPEKIGRNPRTGEQVTIPAKTAITIKAGSKLKDALN